MEIDNLETEVIDLEVEFGLYEFAMEGREGYYSKVRPNHCIPSRDYAFMGVVEFHDRELLKPGQSCRATIKAIIASQDKTLFKTGFAWHVTEAYKIVGYAKVI